MTTSALRDTVSVEADDYAPGEIRRDHAPELPHRSTRELEAIFAEEDERWPLAGLALGLAISAGLWAGLAAILT